MLSAKWIFLALFAMSSLYMVNGITCDFYEEFCCDYDIFGTCDRCCPTYSCYSDKVCCEYTNGYCTQCCDIDVGVAVGLIVGLAIGIPVLIIIGIVICCCFCPGCPGNRRRRNNNNPPQQIIVMGQQNPGYYDASGKYVNQPQPQQGAYPQQPYAQPQTTNPPYPTND